MARRENGNRNVGDSDQGPSAVGGRADRARRGGRSPPGCQFIEGEPSHTDEGKCGRPVSGTTAFCEAHRARCHLPPPEDEAYLESLRFLGQTPRRRHQEAE